MGPAFSLTRQRHLLPLHSALMERLGFCSGSRFRISTNHLSHLWKRRTPKKRHIEPLQCACPMVETSTAATSVWELPASGMSGTPQTTWQPWPPEPIGLILRRSADSRAGRKEALALGMNLPKIQTRAPVLPPRPGALIDPSTHLWLVRRAPRRVFCPAGATNLAFWPANANQGKQ